MKKHLVVFLAFQYPAIISRSFDSLENIDADFFIVENKTDRSPEIENYFKNKSLIGYIQFQNNIANSAMTIFIKEYIAMLQEYQFITFTDGDLFVANAKDIFDEIFEAFGRNPEIAVSSADLWTGNDYRNTVKLDDKDYLKDATNNNRIFGSIEGNTGNFLLTVQNHDLNLVSNMIFVDSFISQKVNANNRRWYKTQKHLAYHLTWDLYIEGHEYYEWKKQVYNTIWFKEQHSDFKKIK